MVFLKLILISFNILNGNNMNIVIIGSTGGIGTALSKDLIKNNNLYIGSRNVDKINNLISTINNDSQIKNKLDGFKVDVTDFLNQLKIF